MKNLLYIPILLLLLGCDGFLDEKPSKTLDTPSSFEALQALLDNSSTMNFQPALPLILGGEYVSDDAGILALPIWQQNLYLWKSEPFQVDDLVFDWRNMYNQVQNANVILEQLELLPKTDSRWSEIRGAALFFRAHAYYNLYSLFLDGPNLESLNLNLSIPVRRSTQISLTSEFVSKEEIKSIIKEDVEEAVGLLPNQTQYPFRPSKTAAYALQARIYLAWAEYELALQAAENVLNSYRELLDYKTVNPAVSFPFELFNKEVIWQSRMGSYSFIFSQTAFQVDPDLYSRYESNDLRRSLFYVRRSNGLINYRGSYDGSNTLFTGLTTAEMLLIRAECLARDGEASLALVDLNDLLTKRYNSSFQPIRNVEGEELLKKILEERRKELVFRGTRWSDLRRLNREPAFQTTMKRTFQGQEFELAPQGRSYALPIPPRELSFVN
ncbi:RagB/SusD family nutrient uptake outer membrane protein [Algoriphagus lacus]|uniref:RagB/SusD family nutrient uptake outer membrane protein n=1 Tax=Algoriphagus lacus TaxID=2056311 RepID=A0A418PM85_9BACT|nr:RagB/SusD family nutrient uptake outer membrane protein [Algoriphagus lacus]RIW12094.1 RagB/SusD family nutrient uptake outer membrane protein [Algoriphagus lacus]